MDKPSDENGAFRSPPGEQAFASKRAIGKRLRLQNDSLHSRLPVICQRRDAMPNLLQVRITAALVVEMLLRGHGVRDRRGATSSGRVAVMRDGLTDERLGLRHWGAC